jgi:hypothetical protein
MDKALEHKIKVSKVQQMKNPVILMNADDLKSFEEKVERRDRWFYAKRHTTIQGYSY